MTIENIFWFPAIPIIWIRPFISAARMRSF